jgi:hypothetical protein
MSTYRIVSDRTRFDVSTRPGMAGLGARVSGIHGWFELSTHADGTPDLAGPVDGALTLVVDDVRTGNQLVSESSRALLGEADEIVATIQVSELRAPTDPGDDRRDVVMVVEVAGREVKLVGTGRVVVRPDATIEATGATLCDPRAFGISLPPLLNLVVQVRWRVTLEPG